MLLHRRAQTADPEQEWQAQSTVRAAVFLSEPTTQNFALRTANGLVWAIDSHEVAGAPSSRPLRDPPAPPVEMYLVFGRMCVCVCVAVCMCGVCM